MKPSPLQTTRATPTRGRPKDAGVLLSRRSDSNSGESKIPKIAVKGAFEESPVDFTVRSPEQKIYVEGFLESPISNPLASFDAEDEEVLGSGEFDGGSPLLFSVKEEAEEKVEAAKAECPAATAETPAATNNGKSLVEAGRSMDLSHGSKGLLDAVAAVAIDGGLRGTDGGSGLTLTAKVRIGLVFFLIGWVITVNILAVSAVIGGGRCGHKEVFSGLPPT